MPRAAALLAGLVALTGCDAPIVARAEGWHEADPIFQSDPRWVGGDGAETIPLGDDRVLWLFGDSFISRGDHREREGAAFIRNSAAIQTGLDPSRAFMAFYWSEKDGRPGSFIPESGSIFYWPGQGVRLDDTLFLFYGALESGDGGTYSGSIWKVSAIDNPDDEPSAWTPRDLPVPDAHGINLGTSVFVDGEFLDVAGSRGDDHDVYLVRWPLADVRRGDLMAPEWWCGAAGFTRSCADPAVIIPGAAPELSIHHDAVAGRYLEFETLGFGDTTFAVRWAPRPEGPWSAPEEFYRPPESEAPYAFVYAGKAHPGLSGADVVLTYVPSLFPESGIDDPTLYYPRFVRVTLEPR